MKITYLHSSPSKIAAVTYTNVPSVRTKGVTAGKPTFEKIANYENIINPTPEQVEKVLLNCHEEHVLEIAAANQSVSVGSEATNRVINVLEKKLAAEKYINDSKPIYKTPTGYSVEDSEDGPYLTLNGQYVRYLTDKEYKTKVINSI